MHLSGTYNTQQETNKEHPRPGRPDEQTNKRLSLTRDLPCLAMPRLLYTLLYSMIFYAMEWQGKWKGNEARVEFSSLS